MSLEFDNEFGLENPYETSNSSSATTNSALNAGFVGNLNDNNKYIDNSKDQTPYWAQGGSAANKQQEFISLGTEEQINSTFELNIDNPYLQKSPDFSNAATNNSSLNPLLQQMNELSSKLYNISNDTADVSGIGGVKEHEIVVKIDHDQQPQQQTAEIPLPLEQKTAFLGNTTSLPLIDDNPNLPSSQVVPQSLSQSVIPQSLIISNIQEEEIEEVVPSKGKKILVRTLIFILSLAVILFLVFWLIEFFGVTDFVVWPGFDPSTTVN